MNQYEPQPVATRSWMFILFIISLPLINFIIVPILALTETNETKKNFYCAILWWFVILTILNLIALGIFFGAPYIFGSF